MDYFGFAFQFYCIVGISFMEKKHPKQIIQGILLITFFTGSVFLTSGKFVNATNTPKLYFVLMFGLLSAVVITLSQKQINLSFLSNRTLLWGISSICFLQACYGLAQFVRWLPSNHSQLAITGSFDNPAGFAAILAMGMPVGLYLLTTTKEVGRYLISAILVVIATATFFSESRTGILAIMVSSAVFLLLNTSVMGKFRRLKYHKLLASLILVCCSASAFVLYHQKKDSANGRLLIWQVSTEMITDKPVFGHGDGSFQAKYMDYQAEYFKNNPDSEYALLADNVKHPFNEFIKVAVEFGIIGLLIVLSLILFVLSKIWKSRNEHRELIISGLTSFLILTSFSYPLQYIAFWLLLTFYLFALLSPIEIRIRRSPGAISARIAVVIVCVFSIFHFITQIQAEIKWKAIALNSLRGNTEKMLSEYESLYSTSLKQNPYFLYNYGAELNYIGKIDKSIEILTECTKQFNDYDLQMLLADNYNKKGEKEKAVRTYLLASNMIPCRFLPLYQIFVIYRDNRQNALAKMWAKKILEKEVKVPSVTVTIITDEARDFINNK